MRNEFASFKVTPHGVAAIEIVKKEFETLLNGLETIVPNGRGLSIVRTKLEEACMFAVKATAEANQQ